MSQLPLVSIGVASYNLSDYVIETLESIRTQSYPNKELVIVDDFSTDNSRALIENWIKTNKVECTFIKNPLNMGINKVCNIFLDNFHGKYIALLGADDLYLPGKFEHQVAIMEDLPDEYAVLYGDAAMIDETGADLSGTVINYRQFDTIPEGNIFSTLFESNYIAPGSALTRRDAYKQVGKYDETTANEDWDMMMRMAFKYKFKYDNEITSKYRVRKDSYSRTLGSKGKESSLITLFKFYGYSKLSDQIIEEKLKKYSFDFYVGDYPKWRYWGRKNFKYNRTLKSFILYIMAITNTSYWRIKYIKKLFPDF